MAEFARAPSPAPFVTGDCLYLFSESAASYLHCSNGRLGVPSGPPRQHIAQTLVSSEHAAERAAAPSPSTPAWPLPLRSRARIALASHDERFIGLLESGELGAVAGEPSAAPAVHLCRLDDDSSGGGLLVAGQRVELRCGSADGPCVQVLPDGRVCAAPSGGPGCSFILRSEGAPAAGWPGAADGEDAPEWVDPRRVSSGRMPAHVLLRSHRTEEEALARAETRTCLSGEWDFLLAQCPAQVPADFAQPGGGPQGGERGLWGLIAVPANWQLAGVAGSDPPIYTNVAYPWKMDPPYASDRGLLMISARFTYDLGEVDSWTAGTFLTGTCRATRTRPAATAPTSGSRAGCRQGSASSCGSTEWTPPPTCGSTARCSGTRRTRGCHSSLTRRPRSTLAATTHWPCRCCDGAMARASRGRFAPLLAAAGTSRSRTTFLIWQVPRGPGPLVAQRDPPRRLARAEARGAHRRH